MNQIMISYRREDSADVTGRIYDRLVHAFGRETVFKDVDSIPLGVNFKQHLDTVVSDCRALVVVIGQKWLVCADASGGRRLDDPQDVVRLEIEAALESKIPVVPLLVQGASMPHEATLPSTLKELASCNGATIGHDPHFQSDMDRLIGNLAGIIGIPTRRGRVSFAKSWRRPLTTVAISAGLSVMASYSFFMTLGEPFTAQETVIVLIALLPFVLVGQRLWARFRNRQHERR
jgi:hypothetical protein